MQTQNLNKQFFKYVLPSMFSMLLSGFYSMVDGFFVGNAVGDTALAAINLVYPVQAVLNATAIGIGIAASVLMSMHLGKEEEDRAHLTVGNAVTVLLAAGIFLPVFGLFLMKHILHFLGADGMIYEFSKDYITIILAGGIFPVLGNALNPLIRNHGRTITATVFMSAGLITNLILDYVFIYRLGFGISGAALATIIAQAIVALFNVGFLFKFHAKGMKPGYLLPRAAILKDFLRIGASPFGQTLIPSFIIMLTNWQCLKYGGDDALAIYSILSYVLFSVQLMLQGIGDGVQPLISFYCGAGKKELISLLYRKTVLMSVAAASLLTAATCFFSGGLAAFFGASEGIWQLTKTALMITSVSYIFFGLVKVISAFCYAMGKTAYSTFLIYAEPCAIAPASLLLLGYLFGLNGIWIAYPVTQVILCGLAVYVMKAKKITAVK